MKIKHIQAKDLIDHIKACVCLALGSGDTSDFYAVKILNRNRYICQLQFFLVFIFAGEQQKIQREMNAMIK